MIRCEKHRSLQRLVAILISTFPVDGRLTFVETVHVQLSDKRRDVRVLEVLPGKSSAERLNLTTPRSSTTYARTLEKSVEGDMTKLSLLFDHDIRFCIAGSSNILKAPSAHGGLAVDGANVS